MAGRRVKVGDVADDGGQPRALQAIVGAPGLAARVVGNALHLMRHQVRGGVKPAQGEVQFRAVGQPVLQEFDIRHDDLGGRADLLADLGHEDLLARGSHQLGGARSRCRLDQHCLIALDRFVTELVGDLVRPQQDARCASHLVRDPVRRHGVEHQQESRHPEVLGLDTRRRAWRSPAPPNSTLHCWRLRAAGCGAAAPRSRSARHHCRRFPARPHCCPPRRRVRGRASSHRHLLGAMGPGSMKQRAADSSHLTGARVSRPMLTP